MKKLAIAAMVGALATSLGGCVIKYKGIDMENGVPKRPRPISRPTSMPAVITPQK